MLYRLLFFLLLIISCTSCTNTLSSKTDTSQELDTIVDFSRVDVSPYFKACEKLLDASRTRCFRIKIQKYFTKELKELELSSNETINETISVILLVDKNGKVSLKELIVSDIITNNFPNFKEAIHQMVIHMPKLHPALKRGIPVATEYKLPINITVE